MNVKIENYRGFDIVFIPDTERFSYSIDVGTWMEKQTYKACKSNIDEYLKKNIDFKPFLVRNIQHGNIIKIVGVRKDNRFIYDDNGVKEQMSEYSEKDYILFDNGHDVYYDNIKDLLLQINEIRDKISEEREKITGKTLRDVKENYIQKL